MLDRLSLLWAAHDIVFYFRRDLLCPGAIISSKGERASSFLPLNLRLLISSHKPKYDARVDKYRHVGIRLTT
jgi:hypothetical protein